MSNVLINKEIEQQEKNFDFSLVILFYSVMFLPKIGVLDLKSIVLAFFFFSGMFKGGKILLDKHILIYIICLIGLCILFICNSLFYSSSIYILLRYLRVIYSIVCLITFLWKKEIAENVVVKSFLFVIFLHATTIFIEMLFPSVRQYIYILSGYTRKELPLRASGLVSGYDFAGFYLIIGIIASVIYNSEYRKRTFSFITVYFVIATIFTSRINILFLCIVILIIVFFMIKMGRIGSLGIIALIVPFLFVGVIFSILTFDVFLELKNSLMSKYSWISLLNAKINSSYSNNALATDIKEQFFIAFDLNIFSGNANTAKTDPGYINILYESGLIGMLLTLIPYLNTLFYAKKNRFLSISHKLVLIMSVLVLIYNLKLIFTFASGVTEVYLVFLIIALKKSYDFR